MFIRVADYWVFEDEMEKIIILAIVFSSIGFLIWKIIKSFKGKDLCRGCVNFEKCGNTSNTGENDKECLRK